MIVFFIPFNGCQLRGRPLRIDREHLAGLGVVDQYHCI